MCCAHLAGDRAAVTRLEPDYLLSARPSPTASSGLLFERVWRRLDATPAVERLREYATAAAVWELRHQQVLGTTPDAVRASRYSANPPQGHSPRLQPLHETTAFAREAIPTSGYATTRKKKAAALLAANGFERRQTPSGQFISYQDSYSLRAKDSTVHVIDLHWQPMNSVRLSRVFNYDELLQRAGAAAEARSDGKGTGSGRCVTHRMCASAHARHASVLCRRHGEFSTPTAHLAVRHSLAQRIAGTGGVAHSSSGPGAGEEHGSILLNGLATAASTRRIPPGFETLVSTNDTELTA